ncbi:putative spermidine/putrescine transport system ATP-binding protein [Sinorhizobium kostiense]|uniref:Spermidine/putrescine import ATP-binding protein PotA n=1 Tax=Sinorhizobium kostiense TaxID=76747 RepID=A0ABS4QZR2_9HYPH|nr:ABC transporter ATP-binding protein [Sinorhizobium kostiense]MBP2236120.1 putative spermidine/putrescine transport system ATP-binding protein [Sinorhizobium kostiense]
MPGSNELEKALNTVKPANLKERVQKTSATLEDAIVRFVNVQKTYDSERLVVRNLSLNIARGEFLTLLGPSGSGKTTTLMMLAGFEPATHGEILLNGKSINRVPPDKRGIGMVFQNYALFPHMTVAENLAFPLQVRSMSKVEIKKRVNAALEMVELETLGNRRPAQLSGGQQQRVAVARALIFEPELVLMDEPLGALDKRLREQMQYEIKSLHDRLGVTIVYVTHDQSEALTMSDRVAVFNDGEIQQLSRPADLYEKPATAFVADFIGENNCLTGLLEDRGRNGICAVRLPNGQVVKASQVGELGDGNEIVLSVRPERVVLNPSRTADMSTLEATVDKLIYHGDHVRIRLTVAGQKPIVVKVANDGQGGAVMKGDVKRVGWLARDCRAFKRGAGR